MPTIYDFPPFSVSKQLFHVPGAAVEGGYTSGAVRIVSPEPGGRSVLEMQVAMQTNEWSDPISSWVMSSGNGRIFRIPLTKTPQLVTMRTMLSGYPPTSLQTVYTTVALEGSTTVTVDMKPFGPIAKAGHVIGHGDQTYLIDAISYDAALVATITVTPPLRKDVAINDGCLLTPNFLGTISNIEDVRITYDAENAGAIQMGKMVFSEAIV